jgi:Domain of unknown function (DUF4249)
MEGHSYRLKLLFLFCCIGCVRNINLPFRTVSAQLVVEGSISTEPPPYAIKLSYSGRFNNTYQAGMDSTFFITDARVVIEDDQGDSESCVWVGLGTYESVDSTFVGVLGRSYRIKIYLSNGKTYVSSPERILPVPPIDSVTVIYDSTYISDLRPSQLIVTVNSKDPAGIHNFYRWSASGYIPRYACCTLCCSLCEQYLAEDQINILSDQFVDGKEIIQQPVYYSPLYWFGKHFIDIKQYSISQTAYLFWQQYLDQTNRTGSILDPLPASLIGNIYNQADSSDIALGLFSASDVFEKKVVLIPFFLQQYLLLSIAGSFVQSGDCQAVYPNALPDNTNPVGWENAEIIDLR